MRLHVPSLPWTQTTAEYVTCAYTQKVVKFCQMMESLGHEVILYSGEENEAPCTRHVPVVFSEEQEGWFGKFDPNDPWTKVGWAATDPWWMAMNHRVIAEIATTESEPTQEVICLISGWSQQPIASAFPTRLSCEWGIGYEGVVPDFHWCFESSAWMHHVYARQSIVNGRWYDTVIPNSFDPADFESPVEPGSGGYLLFIGRLVERKGPHIAAAIAERLGMKLVVAGPGATEHSRTKIVAPEVTIEGPELEWVGPVGKQERADLMRGAVATLVPTIYIEPFGGVGVEAMMAGCPVVATPWGAFNETVVPDVSGYTFHTLQEGCDAVQAAMKLSRADVRAHAERYSIWNVRHEYDRWLKQLLGLWGDGWDA